MTATVWEQDPFTVVLTYHQFAANHAKKSTALKVRFEDFVLDQKTTLARLILGFLTPTAGQAIYNGQDIWHMSKQEWLGYRQHVQAIYQDPYEVYNPFYKVDHVLNMVIGTFNLTRDRDERRKIQEDALEIGSPIAQAPSQAVPGSGDTAAPSEGPNDLAEQTAAATEQPVEVADIEDEPVQAAPELTEPATAPKKRSTSSAPCTSAPNSSSRYEGGIRSDPSSKLPSSGLCMVSAKIASAAIMQATRVPCSQL